MEEKDFHPKMMSLDSDYASLGDKKIEVNKLLSGLSRKARQRAKGSFCLICGKECSSFCNSHSVPQLALHSIDENGKVAQVLQGEIPLTGEDTGVDSAGTFHIICNDCDSTAFQDYENADAYSQQPTERMLAQIAMKNVLQMISKRKVEKELYDIMDEEFDNFHSLGSGKSIEEIDLTEYEPSLQYALHTLSGNKAGRYHLCFYRVLDYVVPVATQAPLCLVGDLEDKVINNIYNFSEKYHMAYLHLAVLPLKETSVVLLFVENGVKRYRQFIRQLNKLAPDDQLAAINYIIFSYVENTFMQPSTYRKVKENSAFMEVCRRTTNIELPFPAMLPDSIQIAIEEHSLSKRNTIPNLLSREYAIKDK